jgi:hypothetical protein
MYKTTTDLLAKQLSAIGSNVLPAKFLHAITLTAHLGFRYLWIDALCIVQDDRDDWKQKRWKWGLTTTSLLSQSPPPQP